MLRLRVNEPPPQISFCFIKIFNEAKFKIIRSNKPFYDFLEYGTGTKCSNHADRRSAHRKLSCMTSESQELS